MSVNAHIKLPFRNSHAFIIGINDYHHITKLRTATNDALGLAQRLKEQHGYQVHEPLINANKAEMLHWLKTEIPQKVKPKDRVFIYFAGHGIALNCDDGPNGYLVPADAKVDDLESMIPMDILHETINELPCKHGLLVLDCCFAGAFRWSSTYRDVVVSFQSVLYEERFWQYTKDAAWQVITSSASDQKASDSLPDLYQQLDQEEDEEDDIDESRHSPFALALFDAIGGEADLYPKGIGDGVITGTELFTYIRDRVEDQTMDHNRRQSPSFFTLNKHDKGQYIFLSPRHPFNLPPIPNRNPFMGLESYEEEDAEIFFGRDSVINELAELIEVESFIVVSGESGTGKSSVIKAGLIPELRKKDWQILPVIRPGKEPLENLQQQIPDIQAYTKSEKPSLLVIDQYEELITQCLNPVEKAAFEQLLVNWMDQFPHLKVIISVRADFEDQLKTAGLTKEWEKGRYQIPGFTQEEWREIIVKPTVQEVLFYEPQTLVAQMVDDVNDAPGALPLLSFTLSELYHAYLKSGRENRSLIKKDYEKIGGISGALQTRAEAFYNALDHEHADTFQKLMLRMVSLEAGELTSRRVLIRELMYLEEEENVRMKNVIEAFVKSRLILTGINHEGRQYLEPAHDALIQNWKRPHEWVEELGKENLHLLFRLDKAQEDYEENLCCKKAEKYLWDNNPYLDVLDQFLRSSDYALNIHEEKFVHASFKLRHEKSSHANFIRTGIIATLGVVFVASLFYAKSASNELARIDKIAESAEKSAKKIEEKDGIIQVREREIQEISFQNSCKDSLINGLRAEAEKAKERIRHHQRVIRNQQYSQMALFLDLHLQEKRLGNDSLAQLWMDQAFTIKLPSTRRDSLKRAFIVYQKQRRHVLDSIKIFILPELSISPNMVAQTSKVVKSQMY